MSSAVSAAPSPTFSMGFSNVGAMRDILAAECPPLQFLRELTENGIQAVQLTGRPGRVVWRRDAHTLRTTGINKLSCIDTGVGMTHREMHDLLNRLSSSGHEQGVGANHGLGVKIAGLTASPHGLVYRSWKNGVGAEVTLCIENGHACLREYPNPDGGAPRYFRELAANDPCKPSEIRDHGTVVVLMGDRADADTMAVPADGREEDTNSARWVFTYLNRRYFTIPSGVRVSFFEENPNPLTHNAHRYVIGQKGALDRAARRSDGGARGSVSTDFGQVHWWVMPASRRNIARSARDNSAGTTLKGHIAALMGNELYDIQVGQSAIARLQESGVVYGHDRVTLYFEPNLRAGEVSCDAARTTLKISGRQLPWTEWARAMRDSLPAEITEMMDAIAEQREQVDYTRSVRDRFRQYAGLFTRFLPSARGRLSIGGSGMLNLGDAVRATTTATAPSSVSRRRSVRRRSSVRRTPSAPTTNRSGTTGPGSTNARQDNSSMLDTLPTFDWVSADTLGVNDRIGRYIEADNLLQLNADFTEVLQLIDFVAREYRNTTAARVEAERAVRDWMGQKVAEAVMRIRSRAGSAHWTDEQIADALTPQGLTMASLDMFAMVSPVKRAVGSRIGRA